MLKGFFELMAMENKKIPIKSARSDKMKLHHKIIFLPILVLIGIFSASLVTIEYQQRHLQQEKLASQLKEIVDFSVKAVDLVNYTFDVNDALYSLDSLADKIAEASNYRISYFYLDGQLLGDSALVFSDLAQVENQGNRPEIIDALQFGVGQSSRYSTTIKQQMVYFAKYDKQKGLIARVSLPKDSYEHAALHLRWSFSLIFIITLATMISFAFIATKLIALSVQKERQYQENIIISRSQDNSLIQAMSTMLNAAHSMDDAARLLEHILPQLLPNVSGAMFIARRGDDLVQELAQWGNVCFTNVAAIASTYLANQIKRTAEQNTVHYLTPIKPENNRCLWLNLSSENSFFGLLYLVNEQDKIDVKMKQLASKVSEQIASALSNLQIKENLRQQAIRDPLTNLYNRRFMIEAFEQALNRADRQHANLAVLMLDLDHFKQFNDQFGHDAGDKVLVAVAEVLKNNSRLEDISCRYGGEEFCIIYPDTGLNDAYRLAEKLRLFISKQHLTFERKDLGNITSSIGIAVFPNHGHGVQQLIRMADEALYLAKKRGRNCSVVYQRISANQQSD